MGGHLERQAEAVIPAQRTAPDVPAGPPVAARAAGRRRARRLTALGLALWGAAFGLAVWQVGVPTNRGAVVLWAVLAILASTLADLRAGLRSLVVDFLPVFAALAVYDRLRGSADDLTNVAHVDPHLTFDRVLALGRTPTERLQDWLYDPGPPAWYDYAAWALHLSHFLVSTTLLVVLWRLGNPLFRRLLVGLLVLSYAALATYWAYPAVPPWLASDQGHLSEVTRVVHTVWSDAGVERAPRLFSGVSPDGNRAESPFSDPVAALPSLHAAIPLLLTLTLRGIDRRLTWLLGAYTLAMGLALVYGGEHYVFDILMGWGYAYVAWRVTDRGLPGRAWRWGRQRARRLVPRRPALRSPVTFAAAAVLLRLPGLGSPARPDEAGYLFVAGQARPGGPFLYGDLWVDRPPLLVAFFRAADALGGLLAARVLALVAVVALVLAAADAGRTLGGLRGATWAAAVAAGLSATPLLGATAVNGELLGAPLVMAACALGLRGLQHPARAAWPLAGAGALAAMALLVKQNLADALVLLAVTLAVLVLRRELPVRRGVALFAALCGGAAVPLLLTLVWASAWGAGVGVLWETVIGFRLASTDVLDDHTTAPLHRLRFFALAAVAAGIVPLLTVLGVVALRRSDGLRTAPAVGVAAMTATAVVSMALGGSFWLHYLLQLLPATALAAALLATAAPQARRLAAGAVVLALASAVTSVVWAAPRPWRGDCGTSVTGQQAVSHWLRARAGPADTAVTLYGVSNALFGSGVRPAYPYLWSLPVRTLDPRLDRLLHVVSGPGRATWVVRTVPRGSWGLDRERRLARQLEAAYRPVAEVCGVQILLRDGLVRPALSG